MLRNGSGTTPGSTPPTIAFLRNRSTSAKPYFVRLPTSNAIRKRSKICSGPFFKPHVELFMRGHIEPNNALAQRGLGYALYTEHHTEAALPYLEKAAASDATDWLVHYY